MRFLVIFLLLSLIGYSQPSKLSFGVGLSQNLTDLAGKRGEGTYGSKDINWRATRWSATVRYDIGILRTFIAVTHITSADSLISNLDQDNIDRYTRDKYFKNTIIEAGALYNVNITPELYGTFGASVFYHKPSTGKDNQNIQPAGLLGTGWQWEGRTKNFAIEFLYRALIYDYLDGYSDRVYSEGKDNFFTLMFIITPKKNNFKCPKNIY